MNPIGSVCLPLSGNKRIQLFGLLSVAVLSLSACQQPLQPSAAASPVNDVKRGQQLVAVGGCMDCHTPLKMGANGPEPDMTRLLSGHPQEFTAPPPKLPPDGPWNWVGAATSTAFAGPWGISYAINLTPDNETGLGKWSEQTFVSALKTGKHLGVGRPIMPPMPWQGYSKYSEPELKAMFAYLRSLPPIKNRAPEYVPPDQMSAGK
jgi:Cytochrome c